MTLMELSMTRSVLTLSLDSVWSAALSTSPEYGSSVMVSRHTPGAVSVDSPKPIRPRYLAMGRDQPPTGGTTGVGSMSSTDSTVGTWPTSQMTRADLGLVRAPDSRLSYRYLSWL